MPVVETNDIETSYHDSGSGRPIVVLHGATADHQAWTEQLQPLTDEYRVLTYDLRGHGKTGSSDRDRYTIETYVDDLAAFIDALGLEKPVILGHSWGGMVGYAFVDQYPQKISALVTVGSATPDSFSTREWLFRTAVTRVMFPLMGNERMMNAAIWAQIKLFGDDSTVDMDELTRLREAHDCDVPELPPSERSKILHAAKRYYASSWSWTFTETPLLMMYGENEPFIEPHADFLEERLSDCRSVEIPEASHNSQADNPEFIRQQLREFLDDIFAERGRATAN